ncbi:beta strand repeat-containing protein [Aureimonas sp. AU40]|uniref:beta strand repeat-containing protein n=1 Tax=Aureimonas sp. AU40 TaxID=1637747 RepID=UPI0007864D30|nr:hypothetical protein [Aureimonas sp. AU40]
MTGFKTTLLTATALTMLTGAALADNNKAYIHQGSTGNEATITQQGAGNNQAGKSAQPGGAIDQGADAGIGSYNKLTIDQNGQNLKVGTLGNYVTDHSNLGGAGVDQYGNANVANVTQTGSDNSVGSILQTGAASGTATGNTLTITQSNNGNNIDYVGQKYQTVANGATGANNASLNFSGQNNGTSGLSGVASYYGASVSVDGVNSPNGVWQIGANNATDLTVSGNKNSFAIRQFGQSNQASNLTIEGNSNSLGISQDGVANKATVATLANGSNSNSVGVIQYNNRNQADVNVRGSYNQALAYQSGDENASIHNISGDSNNVYSYQGGNKNKINGNITGDSNFSHSNQYGTENIATLSITGNSNYSGFNQYGSDNVIDNSINGNNNNLWSYQSGSKNSSTTSVIGNSNRLYTSQSGNSNIINASIAGDRNNSGYSFSNTIITSKQTSEGLYFGPGNIIQNGGYTKGNEVNLTVSSSDNLFTTYQSGNGNKIDGSIGGSGKNQAFVAQIGNSNLTNFVQNGSGNALAVVQK